MSKPRKNGISVLIASQNAARTVELCVRSFLPFGDELIAVDNGSTDGTVEILERLAKEIPILRFVNRPDIVHLYENRQAAFELSRKRWIMRCDSDFVAHTSGVLDIRGLREIVLNTKPTNPPVNFGIKAVYLEHDWWHIRRAAMAAVNHRIYQYVDGMRFTRLGRLEGIQLPRGVAYRGVRFDRPYWFHCNLKSSMMDRFLRSERTSWREFGDFDRYPTLLSWVQAVIPNKYGTADMREACVKWAAMYLSTLRPYDAEEYYAYPELIREAMEVEIRAGRSTNVDQTV